MYALANRGWSRWLPWVVMTIVLVGWAGASMIQSKPPDKDKTAAPAKEEKPDKAAEALAEQDKSADAATMSSYDQIAPALLGQISFADQKTKDMAEKAAIDARQKKLLNERYDLTPHPSANVKMTRGKPIPVGPAVKLPEGQTWDKLAEMSPDDVKAKGLFPQGFLPLPHPHHEVGGMVFPQMEIKSLPRLQRFDVDFDIPEAFLPEFPPAIFLTTRKDLGDVSKGKVLTVDNFHEVFDGILNAKDLEGVRMLVTQFPQQQFNATADRKTDRADGKLGVSCFDCHVNGHTSGATHLVGDIRPQSHRRRLDTPSLRGVHIQRLFGSQRALKTIEDFSEFEQRAAYFDGDQLSAEAKGVNVVDRGSKAHFMSEVQELLDFPPAPKLGLDGKLDPKKVKEDSSEMRGQKLFFGKANCGTCHPAPFYTDNLMHDLQVERFYKTQTHNGLVATAQGPIKTFPLRGIKESPPYFHDGRLLTLEDTVEFFNLILETKLTAQEKKDLVAFLIAL
jgi:cytochrome c peroxidase